MISPQDWPAILRIQNEAYYEITPEPEAVMRSKQQRSPATCFVLAGLNEEVLAYCLAYPFPAAKVPSLGEIACASDGCSQNLFLHDLAVAKQTVGKGIATTLVEHLLQVATERGFRSISLVAIQQADRFWSKFGFSVDHSVVIDSSYAHDARYMQCHALRPQGLSNHARTGIGSAYSK